jgi:hypothetical protein
MKEKTTGREQDDREGLLLTKLIGVTRAGAYDSEHTILLSRHLYAAMQTRLRMKPRLQLYRSSIAVIPLECLTSKDAHGRIFLSASHLLETSC